MHSPKKSILAVKNAKKIKSILILLIYLTVEAYNSYLRYVAQKHQDEMKETYLKSCNSSLKDETRILFINFEINANFARKLVADE